MNRNVIFFDGICHLCNKFVDEVISRDTRHHYLFAPLQGETAKDLLPPEDRSKLDSVVYFEAGKTYYKSSAILKIVSGLGGAYKLVDLLRIIPASLRDLAYGYVAKNRYAWFGEREFCRLPTPAERQHLLP